MDLAYTNNTHAHDHAHAHTNSHTCKTPQFRGMQLWVLCRGALWTLSIVGGAVGVIWSSVLVCEGWGGCACVIVCVCVCMCVRVCVYVCVRGGRGGREKGGSYGVPSLLVKGGGVAPVRFCALLADVLRPILCSDGGLIR